jgi:8-amino-7-oxononanoate synthase
MLIEHLNRQLLECEARSQRRRRRTATSPCSPHQQVRHGDAERVMLAFCSNDYLGLANHPTLVAVLAEGAARWGVGSGASHLVSGHSLPHEEWEDDLAAWLSPCIPGGKALFFGTGYLANLALVTALGGKHTGDDVERLMSALGTVA